jgi:hypothetical protein
MTVNNSAVVEKMPEEALNNNESMQSLEELHQEILTSILEETQNAEVLLTHYLKDHWESFQVIYFVREQLKFFYKDENYCIQLDKLSDEANSQLNTIAEEVFGLALRQDRDLSEKIKQERVSGELIDKYISKTGTAITVLLIGYAAIHSLTPVDVHNSLTVIYTLLIFVIMGFTFSSDEKLHAAYDPDLLRKALTPETISKLQLPEIHKELSAVSGFHSFREIGSLWRHSSKDLCLLDGGPSLLPDLEISTLVFRHYLIITLKEHGYRYLSQLDENIKSLNISKNTLLTSSQHCFDIKGGEIETIKMRTEKMVKKIEQILERSEDMKNIYSHFIDEKKKIDISENHDHEDFPDLEKQLSDRVNNTISLRSLFQEVLDLEEEITENK